MRRQQGNKHDEKATCRIYDIAEERYNIHPRNAGYVFSDQWMPEVCVVVVELWWHRPAATCQIQHDPNIPVGIQTQT